MSGFRVVRPSAPAAYSPGLRPAQSQRAPRQRPVCGSDRRRSSGHRCVCCAPPSIQAPGVSVGMLKTSLRFCVILGGPMRTAMRRSRSGRWVCAVAGHATAAPPSRRRTPAGSSFNHLVSAGDQCWRDRNTESLRGLDDELKFGGLLDRQISWTPGGLTVCRRPRARRPWT